MKIALLQINPTVGDLAGNARLILDALKQAAAGEPGRIDVAVTPELALVGYLPRDLLLSEGFVRKSWDAAASLAREAAALPPVIVGLAAHNGHQTAHALVQRRLKLAPQQRQKFSANPVAQDLGGDIARVFAETDAIRPGKSAEFNLVHIQQRAYKFDASVRG